MSRRAGDLASVFVAVLGAGAIIAAVAQLLARAPGLEPSFAAEFVLLVTVAALSRRWGIALPGKGFASFVLGIALYAILNHGWPAAALIAAIGVPAGDFLFRGLRLTTGLRTAAHLAIGSSLVGGIYEAVGGATGAAALSLANLRPLAAATLLLPVVTNGTFYLELGAHGLFRRVDPKLVVRWEAVVFAASAVLAIAWTALARAPLPVGVRAVEGAVLVSLGAGLWHVIRLGIRADELRLVQHLARAIATNANLEVSFAAIRSLTGQLLPWQHMGIARYHRDRLEMEILEDTAVTEASHCYPADIGLTGEALRRRSPVVANALSRHQAVIPGSSEMPGSEILVPLYQGGELVGLWSVRHSDPTIYRESDGEMLNLLAPQLALSLAMNELVSPLAKTSDQVTAYFERLTATAHELHASSEAVAAAAARAEQGAARASQLVATASSRSGALAQAATDAAAAGVETLGEGQAMEETARRVGSATEEAVQRLSRLGDVVARGTTEVARLREAAQEVEQFSETIAGIANQTNLLALNATIEAARAGLHGRSFAVVADEVAKLADQSSAEAAKIAKSVEETRRALDRAAALLERLRSEVAEVVQSSEVWAAHLGTIVQAAERTAASGRKIAELAAQTRGGSAEIATQLGEAESVATVSASEAETVALAAKAQLRAVEDLARGAASLSALADRLARATDFVRGNGAS